MDTNQNTTIIVPDDNLMDVPSLFFILNTQI